VIRHMASYASRRQAGCRQESPDFGRVIAPRRLLGTKPPVDVRPSSDEGAVGSAPRRPPPEAAALPEPSFADGKVPTLDGIGVCRLDSVSRGEAQGDLGPQHDHSVHSVWSAVARPNPAVAPVEELVGGDPGPDSHLALFGVGEGCQDRLRE
jgi:hypothetical protein